jgi:hypothetical protein
MTASCSYWHHSFALFPLAGFDLFCWDFVQTIVPWTYNDVHELMHVIYDMSMVCLRIPRTDDNVTALNCERRVSDNLTEGEKYFVKVEVSINMLLEFTVLSFNLVGRLFSYSRHSRVNLVAKDRKVIK